MGITIFSKYRVKYECKYSYLNEDGEFVDRDCGWDKILDGGEFIDIIVSLIQDREFIVITVKEKMIFIEHFDPNTGECADYKMTYEEV